MLYNSCVSTCYNIIFSKPSNTFTYIFYIFTRDSYNQITIRNRFQCRRKLRCHIRQSSICKSSISCINLSVMNAAYSLIHKIFFL